MAFLNNVSRTAISSEDAEQMLAEIVGEIQKNFSFDHIGIGILDYATKDIEIKAEAGVDRQDMGSRIPLGTGIVGRVARTGETALVQNSARRPIAGSAGRIARGAVHPDHLWRNVAGRPQCREPQRKRIRPAGRSDHEHAGRSAGDRPAQFLRLPEIAAAIDHRRAHRHQDAAFLSGKRCLRSGSALPAPGVRSRLC